jgi:hypothetical protein
VTAPTGGVLLVDLENMVGQKAKAGIVTARMQVLIRRAGPGVRVVAACARARITPASAQVLHAHDVALLTVDGSKDAADEALLAEAQRMANDGCHRFVVASNDSRFARLADLGDLEIVIWQTQKPRKDYTARASHIHRLPIPAAAATPHTTTPAKAITPAKAKGIAAAEAGTPAKIYPPVTPQKKITTSVSPADPPAASRQPYPHKQTSPEQPDSAVTRVRPAAAGIGFLTAGVIFGAGAALGDLAVRRLLRYLARSG